jgi:hypothetical protein
MPSRQIDCEGISKIKKAIPVYICHLQEEGKIPEAMGIAIIGKLERMVF